MPESPPRQPPPQIPPIFEQLPRGLLLAVLTGWTSFFCLENLRVTCKGLNKLVSPENCRAARSSDGIVDEVLVIVRETGADFTCHSLANGDWKPTWKFRDFLGDDCRITVTARSASGEHVLFTGRNSSNLSSLFINVKNSQVDVLPSNKVPRAYPAVCYWGNCTILAGGMGPSYNMEGRLSKVEIFNPASNEWACLPDMPHATSAAVACVLDQKIYVAGGTSINNGRSGLILQIFDTVTETWGLGPEMPDYLWESSGAAINGKLYVVGRSNRTNRYVCACFNPESMEWNYTASFGVGQQGSGLMFNVKCHTFSHKGSLWVLYVDMERGNCWCQLEDDGTWSSVPLEIAPEIPNHLTENIIGVVSSVFVP